MKPRGRMDSLNAAVGDLAGALRRRREGREPHVRVHVEDGGVRALPLDSPEAEALLDAAEALVDATAARSESRK
ncbi:MAG TPA: hypothetical protein VGN78_02715 [Solirubrobacteraceae bacterium]|jgi:hypothetical protein|nr:hypothetical protein [Solirubrobacteraceae bacterium]